MATDSAMPSAARFAEIERELWTAFPFPGFPDSMRASRTLAQIISRYLRPGASLLDFGAGHCLRSAYMAKLGFRVAACDDLGDAWHAEGNNRDRIRDFARAMQVDFTQIAGATLPYTAGQFDMAMLIDVVEHLHDSPLEPLSAILELVKPGGYLLITVPNAANLRKRLSLIFGRTNYPPFEQFFWHPAPFRGHVREYVRKDLQQLARFLAMEIVSLRDIHIIAYARMQHALVRGLYLSLLKIVPVRGIADSLLLLARKPERWSRSEVEARRPQQPDMKYGM